MAVETTSMFEITVYRDNREYVKDLYVNQRQADADCKQLGLLTGCCIRLSMYGRIKAVYELGKRTKLFTYESYFLLDSDFAREQAEKFKIFCNDAKVLI